MPHALGFAAREAGTTPHGRANPRSGPKPARVEVFITVRTCLDVMHRWQYSPPSASTFAVPPGTIPGLLDAGTGQQR